AGLFIIIYPAHCGVEADIIAGVAFFNPSFNIVEEYRPRRVGRDGFFKMTVKRIVRKLQAFLRTVGPKIFVHAAVEWFAVFPHSRPPGVVPHASPIALLFKTYDLRNTFTLILQGFESTELGQAAGTCTNDTNTFVLQIFIVLHRKYLKVISGIRLKNGFLKKLMCL